MIKRFGGKEHIPDDYRKGSSDNPRTRGHKYLEPEELPDITGMTPEEILIAKEDSKGTEPESLDYQWNIDDPEKSATDSKTVLVRGGSAVKRRQVSPKKIFDADMRQTPPGERQYRGKQHEKKIK